MAIFYLPGCLKAVWLEIFGPFFHGFSIEIDPRNPPRSPGPAPHINFHEKSAPQTKSKAKWRRTKHPARLPSSIQVAQLREEGGMSAASQIHTGTVSL